MVLNDQSSHIVVGLPPVMDEKSKILILGTSQDKISVRVGEYYSNPRNQFWELIFGLFSCVVPISYAHRVAFLQEHNIAVWDVFKTAIRTGSRDKDIEYATSNDFSNLFSDHPALRCIAFNGNSAYRYFTRRLAIAKPDNIYYRLLASSSDTNMESIERKLADWNRIMPFLEESDSYPWESAGQ